VPVECLLAGIFGLLFGSFLNVCIHRLPRGQSVVRPRSHCPNCERQIPAIENIPLISYLALRGRCRNCRWRIPWRYPIVELLTGLLFAFFVCRDGLTVEAGRDCVLISILVVLAFTDLETRLLPEEFTIGGIVLGLVFSLVAPIPDGIAGAIFGLAGRIASVAESVLGAFVPALVLWLTGWAFEKIRHKEGLGFGDVLLLAAIGAFLGLKSALFTLVVASLAGSIIGLAYILISRKEIGSYKLPLGFFLGLAAIFVCAFGQPVMRWYFGLLAMFLN